MFDEKMFEKMTEVLEENAKIVAKLLVVLRSRGLIKDSDVEFIINEDLNPIGDDNSLEID